MGVRIDVTGVDLTARLVIQLSNGFGDSAIVERGGELFWESVGSVRMSSVVPGGGRVLLTMEYLRATTTESDWGEERPGVRVLRYGPAQRIADAVNRMMAARRAATAL